MLQPKPSASSNTTTDASDVFPTVAKPVDAIQNALKFAESAHKALEAALQQLREGDVETSQLQVQLIERDEEIVRLQSLLTKKNDRISCLERELQEARMAVTAATAGKKTSKETRPDANANAGNGNSSTRGVATSTPRSAAKARNALGDLNQTPIEVRARLGIDAPICGSCEGASDARHAVPSVATWRVVVEDAPATASTTPRRQSSSNAVKSGSRHNLASATPKNPLPRTSICAGVFFEKAIPTTTPAGTAALATQVGIEQSTSTDVVVTSVLIGADGIVRKRQQPFTPPPTPIATNSVCTSAPANSAQPTVDCSRATRPTAAMETANEEVGGKKVSSMHSTATTASRKRKAPTQENGSSSSTNPRLGQDHRSAKARKTGASADVSAATRVEVDEAKEVVVLACRGSLRSRKGKAVCGKLGSVVLKAKRRAK
ncbi:hypothetical protein HK102_005851 [Quaeritorhiza haematococci]|nr:hypothetical protein HK102_005851 [Quaeritorhiza haematococci]